MGILDQFLNQRCTWLKATGQVDEWGEPVTSPPVDIVCRFTLKNATVSGLMGKANAEVVSVIVKETVSVGDCLEFNGVRYSVERVSEPHWVDGSYIGRFIGAQRDEK